MLTLQFDDKACLCFLQWSVGGSRPQDYFIGSVP